MDKNLEKKEAQSAALRANLSFEMAIEAIDLLVARKCDRVLEILLEDEQIHDQIKFIICKYFVKRDLHGSSSERNLDISINTVLYNIVKNNASSSSSSQTSSNQKSLYCNEKMDKSKEKKEDCCKHEKIGFGYCKKCKGRFLCEHMRQRDTCKECKGGSIRQHDKIRSKCKECKGESICEATTSELRSDHQ
jgi:hypothetical protein